MSEFIFENVNPKRYERCADREVTEDELNDDIEDKIDAREVFDLIRNIRDPEYPLTLEELHVVELEHVKINEQRNEVNVLFTPTVSHCSMAQIIGLSIRVKLLRSLPARFKLSVKVSPGSHISEDAVNKQLADKERIAAAMENVNLISTINECISEKRKLGS